MAELARAFGTLGEAWRASEADLRAAGVENAPLQSILRWRDRLDLDAEVQKVKRAGARFLTLLDDEYPPLLRDVDDAPAVIYVRGALTEEDRRALAVVGTRRATTYGRDAATTLSRDLASRGITIVSGLAHGIDAVAHRAALDAGGRTLAVLGSGVDVVYPPDHRAMAAEIMKRGTLISEFPMGTRPEARNFPRRNRLISGLALGVLVVEAPEKSGALITAEIALEQGREVFAVPGSIFNAMSKGANRLIQDGARLVTSADDIVSEFDMAYSVVETRTTTERVAPANETEARLLAYLSVEPIHVDDLVRASGLPIATVSSTLTVLELKGLARTVGPMQYSLPVP